MPPTDEQQLSRRGLLRACGATLATGGTALGAGCRGVPPLGSSITYGTVDVPAADTPAYRDWLPAPSALPGESATDDVSIWTYAPPPSDAPTWTRSGVARGVLAAATDYVGVHVDDVDVGFTTGWGDSGVQVLLGGVDQAAVRETLADTRYERDGSHAGRTIYARTDRNSVVAVGSDGLVYGSGPSSREGVRAAIDAGRGAATRYHEDDESVGLLTEAVGQRRWAWLWPGGVEQASDGGIREDTVGWATAFDHDGGSAYVVETWLFPPGYDPTEARVKRSLKGQRRPGGVGASDASAVDVAVDGRIATIEMAIRQSFVRETLADGVLLTPHTSWAVTRENDGETLTFHHEAGDPVSTEQLEIRADGRDDPVSPEGTVGERIEPGESITVSTTGVEPQGTVRLVLRSADSDRSITIFSHQLA